MYGFLMPRNLSTRNHYEILNAIIPKNNRCETFDTFSSASRDARTRRGSGQVMAERSTYNVRPPALEVEDSRPPCRVRAIRSSPGTTSRQRNALRILSRDSCSAGTSISHRWCDTGCGEPSIGKTLASWFVYLSNKTKPRV